MRALVGTLELIFLVGAVVATIIFVIASDGIAQNWLNVRALSIDEVRRAVLLMGCIIPLRWMSGLYRGAVNGFERQVWLAVFNVVIATARFVGVLAVFHFAGATPTAFFAYQLVVATVEVASLAIMTHRLLPRGPRPSIRAGWVALRGVLGFSMTIAFNGAVWVLITQTDKLVLSRVLSLADYGYFSLAAVVGGGVIVIGSPVAQAVLPRMAKLSAEGRHEAVTALYRTATQLVCLLSVPAAAMLGVFAYDILLVWTGDAVAASTAAPLLRLYAVGNGILAVTALAYYLQYARGDMRLHLLGNALMLIFYFPALVLSAIRWGAVGAGAAWVCAIGLYFVLWVPLVHRRLVPGLHRRWILNDVLPIVVVALFTTVVLSFIVVSPDSRMGMAGTVAAIAALVLTLSGLASSTVRHVLRRQRRAVQSNGAL